MTKYSFLIISILMAFSPQLFSQTLSEFKILGQNYRNNGDIKSAIETFSNGIDKYPQDPDLFLLRGELYTRLSSKKTQKKRYYFYSENELYNNAISDLNKAIELKSDFYYAYRTRGELYISFREFDKALLDLDIVINSTEKDPDALVARGTLYEILNKYDLALNDFNHAIRIDSTDYNIFQNISIIKRKQGKYKEAIDILQKAIESDTTNIGLHNNLGYVYMLKKDFTNAKTIFTTLNNKQPNDPIILNNLGFAVFKTGKPILGLEYINQSISLYDSNSYAYKNRGLIYLELGRKEQACDDFSTALDLGYSEIYDDEIIKLIESNCK